VKWDLDHGRPMEGLANRTILRIIDALDEEGEL
jgi:hypothetical protein